MLTNAPAAAVLPVTDLERTKKFYTEKLGLKVPEGMQPEGALVLEAGKGTMIVFYKRPAVNPEHTQAGFLVKDIEKTVDDLSSKGIEFEQVEIGEVKTNEKGIATLGPDKSAWFKDPDGNIISLNEMG